MAAFLQECVVYFACACMALISLLILQYGRAARAQKRGQLLPPSPPGWPIIGHLLILQQPLHQFFHKLAQIHGPFFYIKLGSISTVVVSSPQWAKEILQMHDRDFADRPQFEASKRLFYNNKTLVTMEHGPMWRDLRKLYTVQILAAKRIEKFEASRVEEMAMVLKVIERRASMEGGGEGGGGGQGVEMRKLVFNTVGNMMTRMLFSKRSFDVGKAIDGTTSESSHGLKHIVEEMALFFDTPVLGDIFPWLAWLDLQGSKKRMTALAQKMDSFFENVLAQRIESTSRGDSHVDDHDLLDLLLRMYNQDEEVGKESIKCILLDLLIGSTDSTTTLIEWTLAELLKNPICLKKLTNELDTLVGDNVSMSSMPINDGDLAKLSYLQAVMKETLRLHPPFPLGTRQMTKTLEKGAQVGAYYLPKNTRVLFNHWAMGRDTKVWGQKAGTFCPDKFLSNETIPNLRGQHFEFLPFGTGRRGCPGMNMALTMAPFVVANLVKAFDWKIPSGVPLDLSEAAGFVTAMTKPLVAFPTLRTCL